MFKSIFLKLPRSVQVRARRMHAFVFNVDVHQSYSQEGEDMVLRRLLQEKACGFYVDVGAHHPTRFSNTYYFYKRGWRGINIEPNPAGVKLMKKYRRRDINLQCGCSDQEGSLDYFMFEESALNTSDKAMADQYVLISRLIGRTQISVKSLEKILDQNLPAGVSIDFMSIDVEGHDLNVIKSNNWVKYRPTYVVVEAIGLGFEEILESEMAKFMKSINYQPQAKAVNSFFFKNGD